MARGFRLLGTSFLVCLLTAASAAAQDLQSQLAKAFEQGQALEKELKYAEALPYYEKAVKLAERLDGRESTSVAYYLYYQANLHQLLGQYAKAEPLYQRSLRIYEAVQGKDDPDTAQALHNLGLLYQDMVQYAKAEPLYQRSLQIREAKLGKDHADTCHSLRNLGLLYQNMDQYAKAEHFYKRTLKIREAKQGPDHTDTAASLLDLGDLYRVLGQYAKAEPLLQRGLQIREAKLGQEHADTATALIKLATLYYFMGEYARAELLFRRSLQIREAKFGRDHIDTASALNDLANLYQDMGLYAQAESLYQRSLQIREAKLGKDHLEMAEALSNLGALYQGMSRYAQAEPLYRRSLQIREAKLGRDHTDTAQALNDLADLYRVLGQYAQAEPLFKRSLAIYEAKLGPDHPSTSHSLNYLGLLYWNMEQYAQAEPLYQRSLQVREAKLGKDNGYTAQSLNNLALLYLSMKQYAKAEPLYQRSLAIREAKLGKDHRDTAQSLSNLGNLYQVMGQYAKAEPLYQRSLQIREAKLGKDHPDTTDTLHYLAGLYIVTERWPEASAHLDRARRAFARHVVTVLPTLGEAEQAAFLRANMEWFYQSALTLGWLRPSDAEVAEASAAWLVNGKGLTHQALAEQHLLARDAQDPKARALVEQLQQTRGVLAALLQRIPKAGQEAAYHKQRQEVQQREQELSRQLALAVARPFRADPWVELREIRTKLDKDAVLIDIACFYVFDFKDQKWLTSRYVAWVTPPAGKGPVSVIDLGEAEAIDAAVEAARAAVTQSAEKVRQLGEPDAAKEVAAPLQDLAKLVLHPLAEAIDGYREWVLCPDGALWLAPWAALPLRNGKFAVEEHLIRHVTSGRDLVVANPKVQAQPPVLFADPDFNLAPALVTAQATGLLRGLVGERVPVLAGRRLPGAIGSLKVTFEFLESGVLRVYDEDKVGTPIAQGRWSQDGGKLTLQTQSARYEGKVQGLLISGLQTRRSADGTETQNRWQMRLPGNEAVALAAAGSASADLPQVSRLPGTALEANAVRPQIKALAGVEPRLHTGAAASEGLLKVVKRPRVLVLSTHGYFLPKQEITPDDKGLRTAADGKRSEALLDTKGQKVENPLLRCGLLLAGCNRRGEAGPGDEDGILTGLEVVGLDLRGTELVVLSACETGLGEVRNGEGVAGLRQAFQLAGAQSVLASLWQVPDRETARLMRDFFGQLAQGRDRAEALRQAQLEMIRNRRERNGAAHPFFWAAFTLTGQTRPGSE